VCFAEVGSIVAKNIVAVWFSYDTPEKFAAHALDVYQTSCKVCINADRQVSACSFYCFNIL